MSNTKTSVITDLTKPEYGLTRWDLRRLDWLIVTTKCGSAEKSKGVIMHRLTAADDELIQRYITAQCSEIREAGGGQATNTARVAGIDGWTTTYQEKKPCTGCRKPFKHTGAGNHFCPECLKDRPEIWGVSAGGGGSRHVMRKEYLD